MPLWWQVAGAGPAADRCGGCPLVFSRSANPTSPAEAGQDRDHQRNLHHLGHGSDPDLHPAAAFPAEDAGEGQQEGPDEAAGGGPEEKGARGFISRPAGTEIRAVPWMVP